jgi:cell wall-associated NlpC family hydrolase
MTNEWRVWEMLALAVQLIGIRYKWAGKTFAGFDCSGLVCELLQSVGLLPDKTTLSSRGLYAKYKGSTVEEPYAGCLLFYGRSKITHVAVALDSELMIEAGGGDSRTRQLIDAITRRAFVRRRRIDRRSDLIAICDPFM